MVLVANSGHLQEISKGTLCGGLSFNTHEQTLEDHFSSLGPISEVVVVKDWGLGDSGFITFTSLEHASDAMRAMNRECLDGCQICVHHAGKSACETRGGAFGPPGHGRSCSRVGGDQGHGSGSMTVDLEDPDLDVECPEALVARSQAKMETQCPTDRESVL
ncbi:hypothetical protein MC885_014642 [Smutsia gigantea]|nr:hypothetical protein MC885_014642 [Smutsia gigantea]